jgi:hypothetical protein|tara:strand:- start:4012 stop:4233 length:222 start_codon:yes stop_codon:yes gene_type:complete
MASSKNKLTEEQIREGIFDKIMNMILKKKTKKVLNILKKNPALKQATDDVVKSIDNLQQKLRKKHGYDHIEFR